MIIGELRPLASRLLTRSEAGGRDGAALPFARQVGCSQREESGDKRTRARACIPPSASRRRGESDDGRAPLGDHSLEARRRRRAVLEVLAVAQEAGRQHERGQRGFAVNQREASHIRFVAVEQVERIEGVRALAAAASASCTGPDEEDQAASEPVRRGGSAE
jgi:hypothetical protein